MKKKVLLAVLAMCVVLSTGGCAGGTDKNTAGEEAGTADETDTGKEESEEESEEGTDEETAEEDKTEENTGTANKGDSGSSRLVSVKNVDEYITIGEYKGLSLENTVEIVTDEDVEAQLEAEMENNREEVTDKDGTVENGDLVTIDFVGTLDGEAFDGGTANNYDLTIGAGKMINGFEDGIIGMKKGETKEVPLTFPEDYLSTDLAGKDVVFKITLQNFRRVPELTDEWVAANLDFTTVEEYKEDIRTRLGEQAEETAMYQMYYNAWSMVLENSEIIEFPQEDIDNCIAEFKAQTEIYGQQANMELEEFIESQGMTEEEFEDMCQQYAEYKVKQNLIIQGIMDAEGLSLDDEECLEAQDELIEAYGAGSLAELIDQYGQVAVDESIGLLRVERFIVDHAEVTDLVSDGDMVGVDGDAEAEDSSDESAEGESES